MIARSLLSVCVAIVAATAAAFDFPDFSIVVLSDSPLGKKQILALPKLVHRLNHFHTPLHAVVHVGDLKDKFPQCVNSYFEFIKDYFFERINAPVFYTPGDNDWTDCHRDNQGRFSPLERLQSLRSLFYRDPLLSDGAKRMRVESQMLYPPYSKYVENKMWTHHGVVFGTVHTVGSNNGKAPWDGLPGGDRPEVRMREIEERVAAAVAWIDAIFDRADDTDAPGVAIFTQAGFWPGWELSEGKPLDGFDAIVQRLAKRSAHFDKPVCLINGDQHDWTVMKPFTPGATHPDTARYGKPNIPIYRIHGEQHDAPKFTAFTLETYQKYDLNREGFDFDPNEAFDIFELKVSPSRGEDLFSFDRHTVSYHGY